MQISWEVRNRFRLFREERDFTLQVNALSGRSILAAEQALATRKTMGAAGPTTHSHACASINRAVSEPCRDGVRKIPHPARSSDHRAPDRRGAGRRDLCMDLHEDGDPPRQSTLDCAEPINLRVHGRPPPVTVRKSVSSGPDAPQRA